MFKNSSHALFWWVNIPYMVVLIDISVLSRLLFVNFPLKMEHHNQYWRDARLHKIVALLTGVFYLLTPPELTVAY